MNHPSRRPGHHRLQQRFEAVRGVATREDFERDLQREQRNISQPVDAELDEILERGHDQIGMQTGCPAVERMQIGGRVGVVIRKRAKASQVGTEVFQ